MTTEEILRLVFSLLGGGLVGGLLSWLRDALSERKARRIEFVRLQLRDLYGPLYFFASANDRLFGLNKRFHEAYKEEYIETTYSEKYGARERSREQALQTLSIANEYVDQVKANNERVVEILRENYFLIDEGDIEVFSEFMVDHVRMKTEIDENGRLETPFMVYRLLGDISFMRPQFIDAVAKRFKANKAKLEKLLK